MMVLDGDSLSAHAIMRAAERYSVTLDLPTLRLVEKQLVGGAGMLIRRDPDGDEIIVVRVEGQLVTVAFRRSSGRIKTFLPPHALRSRSYFRAQHMRQFHRDKRGARP